MITNATYPKHSQQASWSPVVDMIHGMERSIKGCSPVANPGRLRFGNDPMVAGR